MPRQRRQIHGQPVPIRSGHGTRLGQRIRSAGIRLALGSGL